MRICSLIILVYFAFTHLGTAQVKRSVNQFEKGKYDQAFEILFKAMEKDTLHPYEKFTLSVYYLVDTFPGYSIDSSYYYVVSAKDEFQYIDEKELEKLAREEFSEELINAQKARVESVAFDSAKVVNTESKYIEFSESFPNSVKEDSAILLRNKSAFLIAAQTGTWQSYLDFMNKYPDANEFGDAKKKYNLLIYEEKTRDGKLQSFYDFLNEFPETPYRNECESAIFSITTGSHNSTSYYRFLEQFPNSYLVRKTANRLLHLDNVSMGDLENALNDKPILDSIAEVITGNEGQLIPFYEGMKFGFYNEEFEVRLPSIYDGLPTEYLCSGIGEDILLVSKDSAQVLIDRRGEVLIDDLESFEDLGQGIVKFTNEFSNVGAIHKSGEILLEPVWDDIGLINNQFLLVNKNGKWGIYSVSNLELIEPTYDSIFYQSNMYILKSDQFIFLQEEDLVDILDGNSPNTTLTLEDYLILYDEMILGFQGDKEALAQSNKEILIPFDEQRIIQLNKDLFLVSRDTVVTVFNLNNDPVEDLSWRRERHNKNWLSLGINNKWYVKNLANDFEIDGIKDSVNYLTESIIWTSVDDKDSLHFNNQKSIYFPKSLDFEVLISRDESENKSEWIHLRHGKHHLLINQDADSLKISNDLTLTGVSSGHIMVQNRRRKVGLVGTDGSIVLRPEYEAIVSNGDLNFSLLKERKFGAYRKSDSLTIEPSSDRQIEFYNHEWAVINKEGKSYFVNTQSNDQSKTGFDSYLFFNDSSSLVRNDENWSLLEIKADSIMIKGIKELSILVENGQERTFKINTEDGTGLANNTNGLIIAPTYNEIINIGTNTKPLYIGEKYVAEADYYVLVYFDNLGKTVFRSAYPAEEYQFLMCEN